MAYNNNFADYFKSVITKENCPGVWLRFAIYQRDKLSQLDPDTREIVQYIIDNVLVEEDNSITLTATDGQTVFDISTLGVDLDESTLGVTVDGTAVDFTLDKAAQEITLSSPAALDSSVVVSGSNPFTMDEYLESTAWSL